MSNARGKGHPRMVMRRPRACVCKTRVNCVTKCRENRLPLFVVLLRTHDIPTASAPPSHSSTKHRQPSFLPRPALFAYQRIFGRLIPVLLGHELEDEEEAEANSPYLLPSNGDGSGRPQQALAAATTRGGDQQQRLLTSGLGEPKEDATAPVKGGGSGGRVGGGSLSGALAGEETAEGVGALLAEGVEGAVVADAAVVAMGDGVAEEVDGHVEEDAEVVVNTRTVRFAASPRHVFEAALAGQAVGWVYGTRC